MLSYNNGISPIIGIIVMVAVTFSLVALTSVVVFDIGNKSLDSDSSDSSIRISEVDSGVKTTVLDGGNNDIDNFKIRSPSGETDNISNNAGESNVFGDGAGEYKVIRVNKDGSETVIRKKEISSDSIASNGRTATFTQDGYVNTNPPIKNALVKSVEDGVTIDTNRTDSNGYFRVGASEGSDIVVKVQGFTSPEITGELFASGKKAVLKNNYLNFTFRESSAENVQINGDTKLISYNPETSVNEVGTPEQLIAINKTSSGTSENYELVDNIDFSNSDYNMTVIGSEGDKFIGQFDGNGYEIRNLRMINETVGEDIGFINYTGSGSKINNITFVDPYLEGGSNLGLIINESGSTDISNISIRGGVFNSTSPDGYIGSIIAEQNNNVELADITINNTNILASDTDFVGGITGLGDSNIYNVNAKSVTINGNDFVGGFVGSGSATVHNINDSSFSGEINGGDYIGGFVGSGSYNFNNVNSDVVINGKSYLGGIIGSGSSNSGLIKGSSSSGEINGGDYIGGLVGDGSYTIKNVESDFSINGKSYLGGIIGSGPSFNFELIKNASFTGDITGSSYDVGGIAGSGEYNITNVSADGTINGTYNVGGVIGSGPSDFGFVKDSSYSGDVIGSSYDVGGIVGSGEYNITNVSADGTVNGTYSVGGVIGYGPSFDFGFVKDSSYSGDVIGSSYDVGGIVGSGTYNITNVSADGTVNGTTGVGGIIGYGDTFDLSKLNNTTVSSDVVGTNDVGGVIGSGRYDVRNTTSDGSVTGNKRVGGIIAVIDDSNVIDVKVTSDVTGDSRVGGIAGELDIGTVSDAEFTGNIQATGNYIGGLIGKSLGSPQRINKSYVSIGHIKSDGNHVGGIIGQASSTGSDGIKNVYVNGGNIRGNSKVGGIVGSNGYKINKLYVSADVSSNTVSSSIVGTLAGQNGLDATSTSNGSSGEIEDSYWDKSSTVSTSVGKEGGDDASDGSGGTNTGGSSTINTEVKGLTTTEMQGSSASTNMPSLDFTNKWVIVSSDYPEFQD